MSSSDRKELETPYAPETDLIGWDDAIRLWLNGELVYANSRSRSARYRRGAVAVTLQPGGNTVLAKVVNYTGRHGMYFDISAHAKDRASAHMRRGELDRVLDVWAGAAEEGRGNPQLLALAGDAFARRARWSEAADVFRQLVERQPARNRNWVTLAPLLVQVGDRDGYRRHCQQLLALFGDTESPMVAERSSKACVLLPDVSEESQLPGELASRAVTQGADHRFVNFFQLAHGMARYRTGDFQSTLEILEQLAARDLRDYYLAVATHLFLAMTSYMLFAIRWEERDLLVAMGHRYSEYRQRVPMLVPRIRWQRQTQEEIITSVEPHAS